jgi:hypothetical protein
MLPIQGTPAIVRLMDQYLVASSLPATYYRRKAAEARRGAEAVTTRAIKARLHDLARDLDRMADAAHGAAQTADALAGVIHRQQSNTHFRFCP